MNLNLISISILISLSLSLSFLLSLPLPLLFPLMMITQKDTGRNTVSFIENNGCINWYNIFRVSITVYTLHANLTSISQLLGNNLKYGQIFVPKDVHDNYK